MNPRNMAAIVAGGVVAAFSTWSASAAAQEPTQEPAPTDADPPREGEVDDSAEAPPRTVEVEPPGSRSPAARTIEARGIFEIGAYQDTAAVSVLTPSVALHVEDPVAGWMADGRYLVDMVSAASPDIVSTASPNWTEVRHAGNVGGRYKPGKYGAGVGIVTSYTPDYLALGANVQLVQELDEKNLTLVEGYGFGHDVIGRTGTPFSLFNRQLDYHTLSLGLSRVVNRSLVVGLTSDAIIERGDQSKPYRYVPVFSPSAAAGIPRGASTDTIASARIQARPLEQLPLARERLAVTGKLAWRLEGSTIRIEERLYADTWGLRATTTEARWLVDASDRVIIWPHLRFHLQNGVDFWQRAYTGGAHDLPALRTGDRELSPLSGVGVGGGIRLALGRAGARDARALTTTIEGTRTSFADAIYVKERFSGLAVTSLEVQF